MRGVPYPIGSAGTAQRHRYCVNASIRHSLPTVPNFVPTTKPYRVLQSVGCTS